MCFSKFITIIRGIIVFKMNHNQVFDGIFENGLNIISESITGNLWESNIL